MTGMGRGAASAVTGWLHVHGSGGPGHGRGRGREPDQGLAGRDRGLATVWVAMTMATLCVVFAVVLALGKVVAVRHLAGGAADLAALAAADRALQGAEEACGAAEKVAAAQGAVVVRCVVRGEVADVTAQVRFGPYEPEVRSRAGPPVAVPDPLEPSPPTIPEGSAPRAPAEPTGGVR
ncbi:Rv3654c family TadE-like protein [Streptomyces sp. NBC_01221]|uniref:Rv3654c family TadE-like protein n=2 Tax=unclassified Streptomyces TaxID=2593676 RepID=UPI002B1E8D69|nr:Rv3654c family TadE-like protein [Streptomyces sp. NBC_01221]